MNVIVVVVGFIVLGLMGYVVHGVYVKSREHLVEVERKRIFDRRIADAQFNHEVRRRNERAMLQTSKDVWPSGRVWVDTDFIRHSVPAGSFATTMCGLEIPLTKPWLNADVVYRYSYEDESTHPANCLQCLARED